MALELILEEMQDLILARSVWIWLIFLIFVFDAFSLAKDTITQARALPSMLRALQSSMSSLLKFTANFTPTNTETEIYF